MKKPSHHTSRGNLSHAERHRFLSSAMKLPLISRRTDASASLSKSVIAQLHSTLLAGALTASCLTATCSMPCVSGALRRTHKHQPRMGITTHPHAPVRLSPSPQSASTGDWARERATDGS
jgi:hypothetical protein